MNKKFISILISVITFLCVTYLAHSKKPDFIKSLFELLGDIAWPVVTLIIFAIFFLTFQKQIGDLIDRLREFQTSFAKISADSVEKINKAEEIRQKTTSDKEAAEQLLKSRVLEVSELRILRGLIGEGGGREFYSFRRNDYYRPALDSLVYKGLIFKQENKYLLTPLGKEVVKLHVAKSLGLVSS